MFYVYKIENLINKKLYIGYTINPQQRWQRHLINAKESKTERHKLIHKAIKKYGPDNFRLILLGISEDHSSILKAEQFFIKYYRTNVYIYGNNFGYNLTDGGDSVFGMRHSDETKKKMSIARKGRIISEETRKKLSTSNIGKHLGPTKETQEKIKKILLGRPSRLGATLSQETKDKIGRGNTGKNFTAEHRKKISIAKKLTNSKEGEKHHNAKLNNEKVMHIKKLISQGEKIVNIAKQYGVSHATISDIKSGRKWKHLN